MWSLVSVCVAQTVPADDRTEAPPLAEVAPGPSPMVELTASLDATRDVVLLVGPDGALSVADELVLPDGVEAWLAARVAQSPGGRVVIQADPAAPYDAILGAIRLTRRAGAPAALAEQDVWKPGTGLFAGDVVAEPLADALSRRERRHLRPKRYKFPQDPYQNPAPYTAYTLEWGESKVGLTAISAGVLPRMEIGTAPVLDVLGALNGQAKINLTREGPFDAAIFGHYYTIPVASVLSAVGAGSLIEGAEGLTDTVSASYLGLGAGASLQLAKPWSVHGQVYWARPSAKGEISFASLPEALLPGLSLGDSSAIGLGVSGDLLILNVATDLRFNRRDSVYLWARWPFYGRVRGTTSGTIGGFEELANADFMIAYGQNIPLATSLSVAGGYQASWKHVDARIGIGWSAVPYTWLMQAFELSYKFGGPTRREERQIQRGFRRAPDEQGVAP